MNQRREKTVNKTNEKRTTEGKKKKETRRK